MEEFDIKARISLYSPDKGGRQGETPNTFFSCIFAIDDNNINCRILLEKTGPLLPGKTYDVPIIFSSPSLVKSKIGLDMKFFLWEGKYIAEGYIIEINQNKWVVEES